MGEVLRFPGRTLEPLEPVSELIAANPDLWAKLIGSKAVITEVENPAIVLSVD
jgi:hypothetical protein